jgi:hypothetical protein
VSSSVVTARRLSAAALAAAAALGAVALPASATGHPRPGHAQVEISAVQYDSPGFDNGSNRSLNGEWVEITNNSRHEADLDGWTLTSEDGDTYTFDRYHLESLATVRVHTGTGRDTGTDLYQDIRDYVWDNRSDTATLRNDRGRLVDDYTWGEVRDRHHHGSHHHGSHHRR